MHKWLASSLIGAIPTAAYGLWRFGADVDTVGTGLAVAAAGIVPLALWTSFKSSVRQQL